MMRCVQKTVGPLGKSPVRVAAVVSALATALCAVSTAGVAQQPGDLDNSFNGDGRVTTDFGGEESANAVALHQNGRIVVAGMFGDPTLGTGHFGLARYRQNGKLDPSFGGNGLVTLQFPGNSTRVGQAQAVAVQPDERILAGGSFSGFALARFHWDGSPDARFNGDGFAFTRLHNASGIYAIALQSDGKIVAAGQAFNNNTGRSNFALARFQRNGYLDRSFGDRGVVITDFGGPSDFATALVIQPDGKIVAVGVGDHAEPGGGGVFAVARYLPNGSPDPTFGTNGRLTTFVATGYFATAVALQSDGKIVVVGRVQAFGSDFALVRYRSNGALDLSFDGDGVVLSDLGITEFASGVALQGDGKIIVVGSHTDNLGQRFFAVARYEPSGLIDTTFSGDGYVFTDVTANNFSEAFAVVLQPDGRIVAAGGGRNSEGASDFALARYHALTDVADADAPSSE